MPLRPFDERTEPVLRSLHALFCTSETVVYVCIWVRFTRTRASPSPESSCCAESIIVFTPTLPRTARFGPWLKSWRTTRAESAINKNRSSLEICPGARCAGHLPRRQSSETQENGQRLAAKADDPSRAKGDARLVRLIGRAIKRYMTPMPFEWTP